MAAIVFLGSCNPATAPGLVALGALLVATASATQDIVVDAFRVESLPENEQAAGMASYVAAYRIGMLISTAGALFLVSGFQASGFDKQAAWQWGYVAMAALVLIGTATALVATEPERSAQAEAAHERQKPFARVAEAAVGAFKDFLGYELAFVMLAFVVLFKFTDALSGAMTAPFVIDLGFTRNEYAAIVKGVGLAALLAGGFAGGFIARAFPLATSLWIGGILQAVANLAFSALALAGTNTAMLAFAITVENFTSAIGTGMFVAYLSALCRIRCTRQRNTRSSPHSLRSAALICLRERASSQSRPAGSGLRDLCARRAAQSGLLLALPARQGHLNRLETEKAS